MFRLILSLVYLLSSSQVYAQNMFKGSAKKSGREYYVGSNLGKRFLSIKLLSGVQSPGIYHVPESTDISELFAYAGGTLPSSNLDKVHVRSLGDKGELKLMTIDFDDAITSKEKFYVLKNKDTILIERDDSFDNTLKWASLASIIISLVSGAIVLSNNN